MSDDHWIDDDNYVGFERRDGGSGFRIFDRRRRDEGFTKPPSVPTIVRQLRSAALGLYSPTQWNRFESRLEGAIRLAERQNEPVCRAELAKLLNAIRTRSGGRLTVGEVEVSLERARQACEQQGI